MICASENDNSIAMYTLAIPRSATPTDETNLFWWILGFSVVFASILCCAAIMCYKRIRTNCCNPEAPNCESQCFACSTSTSASSRTTRDAQGRRTGTGTGIGATQAMPMLIQDRQNLTVVVAESMPEYVASHGIPRDSDDQCGMGVVPLVPSVSAVAYDSDYIREHEQGQEHAWSAQELPVLSRDLEREL